MEDEVVEIVPGFVEINGHLVAIVTDADPQVDRLLRAAPQLLKALQYAQGEACGGCGDCLICTTLRELE